MNEKSSHKIYDYLLDLILKNKYTKNYKLPSQNFLAEMFGVSRMCAQLALQRLAKEQLIILKKGSGCFINTEYLLSVQNTKPLTEAKIALLFPLSLSKFLNQIYSKIYAYFKKLHIFPVFYFSENTNDDEILLKMLVQKNYDGIIFYPYNSKEPCVTLIDLVKKDYPIVLIDRYYSGVNTYTVSSNHFASSYKIVEYFHNRHCNNICFITEPLIHSSIRQRYDGYQTALSHFPELKLKSRELIFDYGNDQPDALDKQLIPLLKAKAIDSIITNSGMLANFVIINMNKCNLKIGRDIFLALYDEEVSFDHIIDFSYIKLVQDTSTIGNTAAEILCKLLRNEPVKQRKHSIPTILQEVNN